MKSSDLNRVKILVIGPSGAGKSSISNFVAEMPDVLKPNYHPTVGCRILEFEREAPKNANRPGQDKVLIELWDVSGDVKYEKCWPAIRSGAHGVILVFNAENPKHESEIEMWIKNFPKKMNLSPTFCLAMAHHPSGTPIKTKSKPPKELSGVNLADTSVEEGKTTIHPAFDKYFNSLMVNLYEKDLKEEEKYM